LPFRIQELFLVHRDSGILLAHLSSASSPAADRDLVGGMLTAIRDFAQDAFGGELGSELDAIDYGPLHILLEPGPWAYLAVVIDGVAPEGLHERVQDALAAVHRAYSSELRDYDGDPTRLSGIEEPLRPLLESPPSGSAAEAGQEVPPRQPWLAIVAAGAIAILCLSLACLGTWRLAWGHPTPTPTAKTVVAPSATASFTPSPSLTPTPTARPTLTPTSTPTATPTSTPTWTPTPTPLPTATPTPAAGPTPYVGVMIGNVLLRVEPRADSPLTGGRAQQGRPVEVMAIYQDWYQVRWPPGDPAGTSGWVPGRWVGLVSAPPPALITPGP
jgi:Bacterial SH3 domain